MSIKYSDDSELASLIELCYFNDNNGVLRNKKQLLLKKDDVNFKILNGLTCDVKLKSPLVEGTMRFLKQELADSILLKPISVYCIKKDDKYSFY